jgi:hypothetical protein
MIKAVLKDCHVLWIVGDNIDNNYDNSGVQEEVQ